MNDIKLMSKQNEMKIAKSVEQVIELANKGTDPTEALAKVARDNSYNPEVIKRMAECFNTSKLLAVYKQASGADRAESFSQADSARAIELAYAKGETPRQKSASEIVPKTTTIMKNFLRPIPPALPFEKAAKERAMEKRACEDEGIKAQKKQFENEKLKVEKDKARAEKFAGVKLYKEAVSNLVIFFQQKNRGKELEKFASWDAKIGCAFGEKGWKIMTIAHERLGNRFLKRARALPPKIFDNVKDAPYCYIQQALDGLKQAFEANERIIEVEKKANGGQVKVGGSTPQTPWELDLARHKLDIDRFTHTKETDKANLGLAKKRLESMPTGTKTLPSKSRSFGSLIFGGIPSGFETVRNEFDTWYKLLASERTDALNRAATVDPEIPDYKAMKSKLSLELALNDLMHNDEVISKFNPGDTIKITNMLLSADPTLAENPLGLKALLRKTLEQSGALESFDIAQQVETGRKLQDLKSEQYINKKPKPATR